MISANTVLSFVNDNKNYMNAETIDTLLNCAETIREISLDRDRLRRENEALRLDIHFLDNGKKGLY